jgi:hypothetical protein
MHSGYCLALIYTDDNMVHGDQLNETIDVCMSLVCLHLWCLYLFAFLLFQCLEKDEQHERPHQLCAMVSNKANMNKAYLKRFQVKYMHMQARKINYQAVMHRTIWNENKHNTLKTCYVVTFTN